jgi:hypothetical protein
MADIPKCVFCENDEEEPLVVKQGFWFWIECGECGARTAKSCTEHMAVLRWRNMIKGYRDVSEDSLSY